MDSSTNHEKDTKDDRTQTRTVTVIVVVSAFPQGKAIRKEVIVAFTSRATQDVGNQRQAGLALRSVLDGGIDLCLGSGFGSGSTGFLVVLAAELEQLLLDLVRVQGPRLLAVGLGDVVLGGRGRYFENIIESTRDVCFMGGDFVANAEDFTIWTEGFMSAA